MNKRTKALTQEQYETIIDTMRTGFSGFRPNNRTATVLVLEANLGLRIGDILQLTLNSFIKESGRYHLDIVEEKTGKTRTFTVPAEIYSFIRDYCDENNIRDKDARIFPVTERAIQKQLKLVCDYLGEGFEGISTHSFRKYFATEIYVNNDYNIVLVQQLLQHSSPTVTQRYIGISSKTMEDALKKHIRLV